MAPRQPKPSTPAGRSLRLAEALAREQLLQLRVAQVLQLIELAKGSVGYRRVVEIYARLHELTAFEVRCLADRVLAALVARGDTDARLTVPEEEATAASPTAVVKLLRRRLRGRVNTQLRRQVELHTGRSQVEVLRLHVEHALRFARVLPEDWAVAEVVEAYGERLELDPALRRAVYFFALERLAEKELRVGPVPLPEAARQPGGRAAQSLRVLPSGA